MSKEKLKRRIGEIVAEKMRPLNEQINYLSARPHDSAVAGRGSLRSGPTTTDLKEFLQAKLAITSLEDVVALDADRRGLTLDQYLKGVKHAN